MTVVASIGEGTTATGQRNLRICKRLIFQRTEASKIISNAVFCIYKWRCAVVGLSTESVPYLAVKGSKSTEKVSAYNGQLCHRRNVSRQNTILKHNSPMSWIGSC